MVWYKREIYNRKEVSQRGKDETLLFLKEYFVCRWKVGWWDEMYSEKCIYQTWAKNGKTETKTITANSDTTPYEEGSFTARTPSKHHWRLDLNIIFSGARKVHQRLLG